MPLPDPYANEPAIDLDETKVQLWLNAQDAADRWQEHADALKKELMESMGNAHAGLVNGKKVITYRPSEKWATSRLIKDYPDVTRHYMVDRTRSELDINAMLNQHPDIVNQYQVRQFRYWEK